MLRLSFGYRKFSGLLSHYPKMADLTKYHVSLVETFQLTIQLTDVDFKSHLMPRHMNIGNARPFIAGSQV